MILSKHSETTSEIKVKPMAIQVDIRKTFLYKWGKEEGLKEGLKEGEQRGLIKGLKQGKREGLKEGISGIIQVKFGSQRAKQIKNILDKINNINRLEKIKKEVIRAKTWEDFIKFLKNPNSKNKNSKGN
jgi:flagellar biosynthesis/type III secretory pathway protein FliH